MRLCSYLVHVDIPDNTTEEEQLRKLDTVDEGFDKLLQAAATRILHDSLVTQDATITVEY